MFKELASMLGENDTLNIIITRKGEKLIMSILPKVYKVKDDIQKKISPFTISGTPEELEEGFINAISSPIQKVTGLLTNTREFEKSAEKATVSGNSKSAPDSKKKEEEERKTKYNEATKRADELEKAGKLREAVIALEDANKYASGNHSAIQGRIDKLNKILNKPSLFGTEEELLPVEESIDYSENGEED